MPGGSSSKFLSAHHAIKVRHEATAAMKENLVCLCDSLIDPSCHDWADSNPHGFIEWFDSMRGEGEYDRLHAIAYGLAVAS